MPATAVVTWRARRIPRCCAEHDRRRVGVAGPSDALLDHVRRAHQPQRRASVVIRQVVERSRPGAPSRATCGPSGCSISYGHSSMRHLRAAPGRRCAGSASRTRRPRRPARRTSRATRRTGRRSPARHAGPRRRATSRHTGPTSICSRCTTQASQPVAVDPAGEPLLPRLGPLRCTQLASTWHQPPSVEVVDRAGHHPARRPRRRAARSRGRSAARRCPAR